MSIIGVIIASLVNLFLHSGLLDFTIPFIAVILSTGMTACDTQKIKDMYYRFNYGSSASVNKMATLGINTPYFNYINILFKLIKTQGECIEL
ncbi:Bax inhibitor-1 family protein [Ehrlichia ruminantium]|uniref:Bax inhibitor-1 family protein n=1 Tax=Ehrlichia ruminantium TaxID=779 RepID=UPI001E648639|nr:Bax inhibitor-1 family protein [Ehrlichia ruminantium]